MATLACYFSEHVRVGTAHWMSAGHIYPHRTASLCHVESVDIWGLLHDSFLHLPSLKYLSTSVTNQAWGAGGKAVIIRSSCIAHCTWLSPIELKIEVTH